MKSIKELSIELSVSKTAIDKKLVSLSLKDKLVKDGNRFVIPEEVEKALKSAFGYKENKANNNQVGNDEIIKNLQNQIDNLNKQIEKQNDTISGLLESNLQLTESINQLTKTHQVLLANQTTKLIDVAEDNNTSDNKSFWGRIFRKKDQDTPTP